MIKHILLLAFIMTTGIISSQDIIKTKNSSFTLHFVGHGTLYIDYQGTIIHIDPWTNVGNYENMPDADYILITHQHRDHLDAGAISEILKPNTVIIAPEICKDGLSNFNEVTFLANGDQTNTSWGDLTVVPAYNIIHMRETGKPFHTKGEGNGYVLNIDGTNIYVAGDTENIPEMKDLKNIDIAFLPMNLPYTMTPEMTAEAAKMFHPKILYPYHFGDTDTNQLLELLKGSNIEVRVRDMK